MAQRQSGTDRSAETVQLLEVLSRLIRTSRAATQRQQSEYGLTGTPLGILKALGLKDARSGDLAAHLQIAPSVVSRALVPLEQAGLVERHTDPDDARASRLGLTAAGRGRLTAARQDFADRFTPLLSSWERDDVAALTGLMGRLEAALAQTVAAGGPAAEPELADAS